MIDRSEAVMRKPNEKIWVLITRGMYRDHCGWIDDTDFIKRYDRGVPAFLVHVCVNKCSARTGEHYSFIVDKMLDRDAFAIDQMELPFMTAVRERLSSSRKRGKRQHSYASSLQP
jgi:hypothetical protein